MFFYFLKVNGGSYLSIKVRWSKKLLYQDGQFCLSIPFIFLGHVVPVGKKLSKREKIMLNVNSGTAIEVLCKTPSHPLKVCRHARVFSSVIAANPCTFLKNLSFSLFFSRN